MGTKVNPWLPTIPAAPTLRLGRCLVQPASDLALLRCAMANMVVPPLGPRSVPIAIGACLAALGLLAAISAGLPDWAYVAYDFTAEDWYGHSHGVKSEYTIGLYKANHHQEIHGGYLGVTETDDDHNVPVSNDDNDFFDDDGDDYFGHEDDDDGFAYFHVNRASTILQTLFLFFLAGFYFFLGFTGKRVKGVEIAGGCLLGVLGIFGVAGAAYWKNKQTVDDDDSLAAHHMEENKPCTAGCGLEFFVGVSAVVMGIGMCGAAFKAPALVEKGADLEGPTGTEMA
jgi:hypothetical protein